MYMCVYARLYVCMLVCYATPSVPHVEAFIYDPTVISSQLSY